jgi:hypothetical protein
MTETIPVQKFNDGLHKWDIEVLDAFDQQKKRFFMLNWHRRARKTTLVLNLLIREAVKNPKCVYGYIAPTYTQGKSIVWRDPNMLKAYLPAEEIGKPNETELYVPFNNGSLLVIKGSDKPDSIRGLDFTGVGIDEWALCKEEIWTEILRPVIAQNVNRWAMFTFTPKGQNHTYTQWNKTQGLDEWYHSILPASMSGVIPHAELVKAKADMPLSLYQQELECSFISEEESVLITSALLDSLRGKDIWRPDTKKIIACDPATGGDECIIYVFEDDRVIDTKILHFKDTMKIAGEIALISAQTEINDIVIDAIGIGKGIADRLMELNKSVIAVNSAEKSSNPMFANKRAEIYWYVMLQMRAGEVHYPADEELRRQLVNVHYKVVNSNGKILLEPKDKIKERLGRSPDRADAFCYGIWGLQDIGIWRKRPDRYVNETSDYDLTPETC